MRAFAWATPWPNPFARVRAGAAGGTRGLRLGLKFDLGARPKVCADRGVADGEDVIERVNAARADFGRATSVEDSDGMGFTASSRDKRAAGAFEVVPSYMPGC